MTRDAAKRAKHQKACDAWNAANPCGSPAWVKKDDGTKVATQTRTAAYVCDSGVAVVFLDDVRGYYLLDRVTPRFSENGGAK